MEFGKHLVFLSPALFLAALLARVMAGRWAAEERLIPIPTTWLYVSLSAVVAALLPPLGQAAFEGLRFVWPLAWARVGSLFLMGAAYGAFVGKQPYFWLWQSLAFACGFGALGALLYPILATGPGGVSAAAFVAGSLIAVGPIFGLVAMPRSRQGRIGLGGASYPVGGKWH